MAATKVKTISHALGENIGRSNNLIDAIMSGGNAERKKKALDRALNADLSKIIDLKNLPAEILSRINADKALAEQFENIEKVFVTFKDKTGNADLFNCIKNFIEKQGRGKVKPENHSQIIPINQIRKVNAILKNKNKNKQAA